MMNRREKQNGFSLTEALIATGILALGLVMIAMAFPVGVKLTSVATDRTTGNAAASEAFAKIRLYSSGNSDPMNPRTALDCSRLSANSCMDLLTLQQTATGLQECFLETLEPGYTGVNTLIDNTFERFYPSLIPQPAEKRYFWSPLFRRVNSNTDQIQITVFVCRMLGMGSRYYDRDHTLPAPLANDDNLWPVPVKVRVNMTAAVSNEVRVVIPVAVYAPANAEYNFFTEGCMMVEDSGGEIYRVLEKRDDDGNPGAEILVLDRIFTTTAASPSVWVVPPAIGGSRNPCIDVVQMIWTQP